MSALCIVRNARLQDPGKGTGTALGNTGRDYAAGSVVGRIKHYDRSARPGSDQVGLMTRGVTKDTSTQPSSSGSRSYLKWTRQAKPKADTVCASDSLKLAVIGPMIGEYSELIPNLTTH